MRLAGTAAARLSTLLTRGGDATDGSAIVFAQAAGGDNTTTDMNAAVGATPYVDGDRQRLKGIAICDSDANANNDNTKARRKGKRTRNDLDDDARAMKAADEHAVVHIYSEDEEGEGVVDEGEGCGAKGSESSSTSPPSSSFFFSCFSRLGLGRKRAREMDLATVDVASFQNERDRRE